MTYCNTNINKRDWHVVEIEEIQEGFVNIIYESTMEARKPYAKPKYTSRDPNLHSNGHCQMFSAFLSRFSSHKNGITTWVGNAGM
jgi:hypothetical protein